MVIRPVEPTDAAEWLRMRLALWPGSSGPDSSGPDSSGPDSSGPDSSGPDSSGPDSSADDERGEVEWFLAGYPSPTLMAAFVCERPEGGLCGLVEVSIRESAPGCHTDRIGYLEGWYVDPDRRGRGVGRALAERAEAWARAAGCREMASDTNPSYPVSPAAHEALGYEEVERFFRKELSE